MCYNVGVEGCESMKNKEQELGELVKKAREEKGLSARKLAELCNVSHTEINNIEKGLRVKPAVLTLKGFEKYLDLPFGKIAKMVGYSDVTIDFTEKNIIVSYEMYDKYVQLRKSEEDNMLHTIDIKRHMAMDIKKSFNEIYNYLKKQPDVDKTLLKNADEIIDMLNIIELKYEPIIKEK